MKRCLFIWCMFPIGVKHLPCRYDSNISHILWYYQNNTRVLFGLSNNHRLISKFCDLKGERSLERQSYAHWRVKSISNLLQKTYDEVTKSHGAVQTTTHLLQNLCLSRHQYSNVEDIKHHFDCLSSRMKRSYQNKALELGD